MKILLFKGKLISGILPRVMNIPKRPLFSRELERASFSNAKSMYCNRIAS